MIYEDKLNTSEFFEELINNKKITKDIIIEDSGPFIHIEKLYIKRVDTKIYLEVIGDFDFSEENIKFGEFCENNKNIVLKKVKSNKRIEIGIEIISYDCIQAFLSVDYVKSIDNKNDKETILIEYVSNMDFLPKERHHYSTPVKDTYGAFKIKLRNINIYPNLYNKNEQFIYYDCILNEKERRKIKDCISFILGKPIVYKGYSTYTKEQKLINFEFVKSSKFNGQKNLYNLTDLEIFYLNEHKFNIFPKKKSSYPPTKDYLDNFGIIPEKFNEIFCSIYNIYEQYELNEIFWNYWYAESSPYHSAAVQFGACLERIQRRYFEINQKQLKEKIIEKQKEIKEKNNLKIGLQKVRLSIKDKFKILFDALEIEFNELEEINWKFRDDSAHCNKTMDRDEDLKFIKSKDLFKTLFNRVILKISGLDIKYVDYHSISVNEYKSKDLLKGIER
ncbi:hypothetical protein [Aliarcobacter butzleri]|uniref:hypothetical protein n=1 Tax=Aliarcobacter butzleri TaxID=28197 RepID=UPI0021B26004|nr:hypothetical protein [Aliarcobacter butzleri]MCT7567028.1 hypothetical protein [Aliarcobacter butzleri]